MKEPKGVYWDDELIARLSDTLEEWPRSDSRYVMAEQVSDEGTGYVEACKEYSDLVDLNDEEAMEEHNAWMMTKYGHMVNSKEWYLLDEDENERPILAPIFHSNNIMTWMDLPDKKR